MVMKNNTYRWMVLLWVLIHSTLSFAYVEVNGIYYNLNTSAKTASVTYRTTDYGSYSGKIVIPTSISSNGTTYNVTSIGSSAFKACSGLTSVSIPSSVTSIGSGAFNSCSGLTSVTIPNSVTSIGSDAFWNCSGLTSVTIPNSVTSIDKGTFYGCSGLTSVNIPNSVTSIGIGAFRGCSGITSVNISDLAAWCKITFGDDASNPLFFAHHLYLNGNEVKDLVIPNSVIRIGAFVFYGHSALTSLTIPSSVTYIGSNAFAYCSGLTSLTIPNSVTSIGYNAFYDCSGLKSLTIGNSVTSIGEFAFGGCSNLPSVTIPNSVTSIDERAFEGCSSLTSVTIPQSVTNIGKFAFSLCSRLTAVYISDLTAWCKITFGNILSNPLYFANQLYLNGNEVKNLIIPNSVTDIGAYAFNGCSALTSVTIPNSVANIGSSAFDGCKLLSLVKSEIKSPFSISPNVFNGISSNATLEVPKGTKSKYEAVSGWTDNFPTLIEEGSGNNTTNYDITQYITATNIGGSYTQTNNLINSGSQLNWRFSNNSSYGVTLKSMQLIDGSTGAQGNLMSVNQAVDAGTSVSYTTTIGGSGINLPITCRFRYDYNGNEYSTDAVFSGSQSISFTLSIKSTGNGTTSYGGKSIRNGTESFSVNMLGSATISFSPDTGYKIKTVKVGGSDVTSNVSNNKYTISNITSNTSVEVEYVANTVTTYSLSITASGNGSATYNSTSIRSKTQSFTVNSGASATVSFAPDNGYRIASVKVNNTDVTSNVSNNKYTISSITSNTTLAVTFEAIPVTTYSLTISSSGSGSTSYNGTAIRGGTQSFTVNSGSSATVTFSPDSGYKIASVKVNNTDVTSSVSNNQYTISNITANTTLAVTYQATSSSYYSLSITASGNGKASIGTSITRNGTTLYSFKEGSPIVVTFTPDSGNRLAKVTMNDIDVTSKIVNNQFTINAMYLNVTLVATFEEIPVTTYSLSITASGNGSVTYNNTSIRSETQSFTVNEGTFATVSITPDNGYRIATVKVNNMNVTSSVSNDKYTISNITANTTLVVIFEVIPPTTYTLSITASGNGSATYNSTTIKSKTQSFDVDEGTSATVSFNSKVSPSTIFRANCRPLKEASTPFSTTPST